MAVCSARAYYRQKLDSEPKPGQTNATIGTARSKLIGSYAYSTSIGAVSAENEQCPNRVVLSLISGLISFSEFFFYRGVFVPAEHADRPIICAYNDG